jgi:hypothetical protein
LTDIWDNSSGLSPDILSNGGIKGLFNGNIAQMITQLPELQRQSLGSGLEGMAYQYDQLHRIKQSRSYDFSSSWAADNKYDSDYSYDPNGNLKSLRRLAKGDEIDLFAYHYDANKPNRLLWVGDSGASDGSRGDLTNQSSGNYAYDEIGNLIQDNSENIEAIKWNVQGKVDTVDFSNEKPDLFYKYDPMGNRLMKTLDETETTIYIRDAQGNILSTYEVNRDQFPQHYYQKEVYLYGSSRLGLKYSNILVRTDSSGGGSKQYSSLSDTVNFAFEIGNKSFEMSNHLGNVLATLSDMPVGKEVGAVDSIAEYYTAL